MELHSFYSKPFIFNQCIMALVVLNNDTTTQLLRRRNHRIYFQILKIFPMLLFFKNYIVYLTKYDLLFLNNFIFSYFKLPTFNHKLQYIPFKYNTRTLLLPPAIDKLLKSEASSLT